MARIVSVPASTVQIGNAVLQRVARLADDVDCTGIPQAVERLLGHASAAWRGCRNVSSAECFGKSIREQLKCVAGGRDEP